MIAETVKRCEWCKAAIELTAKNVKHCCVDCRISFQRFKRYGQGKKAFGPPKPKKCAVCQMEFSPWDKKQIYCRRNGYCAQKAFKDSEKGQIFFARQDVKEKMREYSRKNEAKPQSKAARKARDASPSAVARRAAYRASEHGSMVNRANQRAYNAARALSAILLPVQHQPEE